MKNYRICSNYLRGSILRFFFSSALLALFFFHFSPVRAMEMNDWLELRLELLDVPGPGERFRFRLTVSSLRYPLEIVKIQYPENEAFTLLMPFSGGTFILQPGEEKEYLFHYRMDKPFKGYASFEVELLYPWEAIAAEMAEKGESMENLAAIKKRASGKERDIRRIAMWLEVTEDETWIVEDEKACRLYTEDGFPLFQGARFYESREEVLERIGKYRKFRKKIDPLEKDFRDENMYAGEVAGLKYIRDLFELGYQAVMRQAWDEAVSMYDELVMATEGMDWCRDIYATMGRLNAAVALVKTGRSTTARRLLQESSEKLEARKLEEARYFLLALAVLSRKENRLNECIMALEKCLKIKPGFTRARRLLEESRREVGKNNVR